MSIKCIESLESAALLRTLRSALGHDHVLLAIFAKLWSTSASAKADPFYLSSNDFHLRDELLVRSRRWASAGLTNLEEIRKVGQGRHGHRRSRSLSLVFLGSLGEFL